MTHGHAGVLRKAHLAARARIDCRRVTVRPAGRSVTQNGLAHRAL